jgi:hypothetical protein
MEMDYIDRWSLWLNFKILARTSRRSSMATGPINPWGRAFKIVSVFPVLQAGNLPAPSLNPILGPAAHEPMPLQKSSARPREVDWTRQGTRAQGFGPDAAEPGGAPGA